MSQQELLGFMGIVTAFFAVVVIAAGIAFRRWALNERKSRQQEVDATLSHALREIRESHQK